MIFDEAQLRSALTKAWSLETAKQWTPDIPAAGQCNVTTVVVHDLFGGDILKTSLPDYDVDHFYNRIDGGIFDLTDSQFSEPVHYEDDPASREEAMECVQYNEYETLHASLLAHLKQRSD